MSNWTEIKIIIPSADVDRACDIANMTVDYGIYIEDYTDLEQAAWEISRIDLIDQDLLDKDRSKAIIHIYVSDEDNPLEAVAYLTERLSAENIDNVVETLAVQNTNWLDGWKKYFKPIEVGNRLAVCPSWETYDNAQNRKVLTIDPGAAFGTGTHETTNLCLSVLDGLDINQKRILDVGCGSGILALSALLLGGESAIGIDIDPVAVKTAIQNASSNHLEQKAHFVCGDLVDQVNGKFDIICANIVADVLIDLCDSVGTFMHNDTVLIYSGIIDSRETDVVDKINRSGLYIEQRFLRNGWVALVCKKGENHD